MQSKARKLSYIRTHRVANPPIITSSFVTEILKVYHLFWNNFYSVDGLRWSLVLGKCCVSLGAQHIVPRIQWFADFV